MKKDKKKGKSKNLKGDTQSKPIADIKEGTYSDGHPLDDVQYLECKIILKGERFTSVESFYEFAKIVKRAAENADVGFSAKGFKGLQPQIREVLFLDTEDYKLYNNAFILRRRIPYQHGFLAGDPEIVFKFRHPDMQKTADLDVRPKLISDYRIKFKAEMLPLKDEIGGLRMLYSHNAQFPLSRVHEADRASMATLVRVFPPLQALQTSEGEKVDVVHHTAVAERFGEIMLKRFLKGDLLGVHLAVNIFIATTVLWLLLRLGADTNPIWAISAMIPALDPQMKQAVTNFRGRIFNALLGCVTGLLFLLVGGTSEWKLPLALSATVLLSSYVIRIPAMWRQAPITAAIIIAAGLTHHSKLSGAEIGLRRVGEVMLGCTMGLLVSWLMSKIWPVPEAGKEAETSKASSS